jgi:hypothetical protein
VLAKFPSIVDLLVVEDTESDVDEDELPSLN